VTASGGRVQVLYGRSFTEKYGDAIMPKFRQWVENIANGQLARAPPSPPPPLPRPRCGPARLDAARGVRQVGFFADLGGYLREAIAEQLEHPERYADERSVMRVYLEARRARARARARARDAWARRLPPAPPPRCEIVRVPRGRRALWRTMRSMRSWGCSR
jgi:hypothetical protein